MFRRPAGRPRAPITAKSLLRPDSCAGCHAERVSGDALLAASVGEGVTDPAARDTLRASHGWCALHLERAVRIATADGARAAVAILYADILRQLDEHGPTWPRPHPVCEVCSHVAETLVFALRDLVIALDRGELAQALAAAAPLCLTHTSAVAALPRSKGRDLLLERGLSELRAVATSLQDFADRQDHRSTDRTDHGAIERLLTFVRGNDPLTTQNRGRGEK